MKKLIYFYCKDLRGFDDTEFNFSSKYKIHFEKEDETLDEIDIQPGKLIKSEVDKNYIDNFFGNNIELNAIIGNNGAGKSTLLKELFDFGNIRHFIILVFECLEEKKFIIFYYDIINSKTYWVDKKLNETTLLEIPFSEYIEDFDEHFREVEKYNHIIKFPGIPFFYITEVLDQEMYNSDVKNYSTGGRIAYAASGPENMDVVHSFFYDRFEKQMNFLSDKVYGETNNIEMPFSLNENVSVYSLLSIDELVKYKEELVSYLINMEKPKINELKENNRYWAMAFWFDAQKRNGFVLSLLSILILELQDFCKQEDKVDSFFNKYTYDKGKGKGDIYTRLRIILNNIKENFEGFSLEKYHSFLDILEKSKYQLSDGGKCIYLPFKADGNGMSLKTFYDEYKKLVKNNHFLYFDWGLSSGETAMLNLYSKFYQIYQSIKNSEKKDVLLLIDEADAYFHPQWQKDYVKDTLYVAEQIFEGFDVQIILSTHSPIMLSDIPKQNVLYLKKEENAGTKVVPREERQETFGANIFSLFKDTFFLEGSGIGSFAEDNLAKLLKRIHNLNGKEIECIKKCIMVIGDVVLRKKFESEFLKYIERKKDLENKKQKLLIELSETNTKLESIKKETIDELRNKINSEESYYNEEKLQDIRNGISKVEDRSVREKLEEEFLNNYQKYAEKVSLRAREKLLEKELEQTKKMIRGE